MNLRVLKLQHVNHFFKVEYYVALLYFFICYIYISKKQLFNSLKVLVKVSLVFIIINELNTDQVLIQIKRLEKVQHIDSARWSQKGGPSP